MWFPVDDALHSHPKGRRAGLEALGLWVISGSFCMAYLTDGFVPVWFVKDKPRGIAMANRLVEAGLWHESEKDGEKGWSFHDWKTQCTKAHLLEEREKARKRKAKSRESQEENVSPSRVTDAERTPNSRELSGSTPHHTTPPSTSVVTSGTDLTPATRANDAAQIVLDLVPKDIPRRDRAKLRQCVEAMLNDGISEEIVCGTVAAWNEKPDAGPGLLPYMVSEAVKRRIPKMANNDQKIMDLVAIGDRLAAQAKRNEISEGKQNA